MKDTNFIPMETVIASITILRAFNRQLGAFLDSVTTKPITVAEKPPAKKTKKYKKHNWSTAPHLEATILAVLEDYAKNDMTVQEVAKKHGVNPTNVYRWARQRNVSRGQQLELAAKSVPENH